MLDFFDQKYFTEECTCITANKNDKESCPVHNQQRYASSEQSEHMIGQSHVDMVEINQSFPRQPAAEHLSNLIEYRIKILCSTDINLQPGEKRKVSTNTMISRKAGKLSMLMKPAENLHLRFLGEGLICPSYRGPLTVELQNSTGENVCICAGSLVAYMILTPFIE